MSSPDALLVLDLTEEGTLSPVLLRRLDELAQSGRDEFNKMVGTLSQEHERDIDWWVSLPSRRNTHVGHLFGRCIQLALIRELSGKQVISIRTSDSAFYQVLVREFGPDRVAYIPKKRRFLVHAFDIASCLFHVFSAWFFAYWTRGLARPVPRNAAIVEMYVSRDSFDDGGFRDRYYPGFYESLDDARKAKFFYLPIFYRIRNYAEIFRRLRRAPQNFLLREDYLKPQDYFFAFCHWWRARRLKGMRACYAGFEIGPLIDAEIQAGRYTNSTLQALLSYRFWRSRSRFQNATLLDWYEGHDTDRATAAAIRWHNSDVRLIAMRPTAPETYVSTIPAIHEILQQVVAPAWLVVGCAMKRAFAARFPTLKVMEAPGLRHRALLRASEKLPSDGPPRVLVLLSIERHLVELVSSLVSQACVAAPEIRWLIKRHPGLPRLEAELAFCAATNAIFVEGSFVDALSAADMVVGLGTNSLIEAAAMGVPVICVSGGNMPTELPFGAHDKIWWRAAYDVAELLNAIRDAMHVKTERSEVVLHDLLGPFDPGLLRDALMP